MNRSFLRAFEIPVFTSINSHPSEAAASISVSLRREGHIASRFNCHQDKKLELLEALLGYALTCTGVYMHNMQAGFSGLWIRNCELIG